MGDDPFTKSDRIHKRGRQRNRLEARALRKLEVHSARAFEVASRSTPGTPQRTLRAEAIQAFQNTLITSEDMVHPVEPAPRVRAQESCRELLDGALAKQRESSPRSFQDLGRHDLFANGRQLLQKARSINTETWLFVATVIVPVLVASVYYCLIASNEYVSEFRFAVKDTATAKAGGAGSLLGALGVSSSSNAYDNYLVTDYLSSRQAVEELQKRIDVVAIYSRPEIDWLSRFNHSKPVERFVSYWQTKITARFDQITGIATAQVRAFTPQDALLVANSLVTLSEELVNGITHRSQEDAVRFAQREVEKAEHRLRGTQARVSEYRTRVGVIDPKASVVASNSTLTQTLQSNLAQLELQEATLLAQSLRPDSPALVALKHQIKSTKEQIKSIETSVGMTSSGRPLSAVVGEYEQLDLEYQFAQKMVGDALRALDQARASASAQQLYITPFVRPSLPESAAYPRPLFSISVVALFGLVAWACSLLMLRSVYERFH